VLAWAILGTLNSEDLPASTPTALPHNNQSTSTHVPFETCQSQGNNDFRVVTLLASAAMKPLISLSDEADINHNGDNATEIYPF